MATYSTGIAVIWNSVAFTEVTSLSWQFGGTRQDRGSGTSQGWTAEPGSVTFTCLGSTGITTASFGKRGSLTITGGGMTFLGDAIFESVQAEAELNGIARYSVTLKIHN